MGWDEAAVRGDFDPQDADRILWSRTAEITIGPESMTATANYIDGDGRLAIDEMSALKLNGWYQTQYAFSGNALAKLGTYAKTSVKY